MNCNSVRFIFLFLTLIIISITIICANYSNLHKIETTNFKIYFSYNFEDENFVAHKNGIGSYINCNLADFEKIKKENNYAGISFETKSNSNEILEILNGKIISMQNIKNKTIIYAFTNKFEKYVVLNGKKCNIQIVCEDEINLVGMPLLLGSY